MPFTVALTYAAAPPLRLHASRLPLWRRLQAVADAAVSRITTLWVGLVTDVREALDPQALTHTLDASTWLPTDYQVGAVWEEHAAVPARQLLPVVLQETVTAAAQETTPALTAQLGVTLDFQPGTSTVQQAIDAYVGTQIRAISATTLQTVREVLRTGWNAQLSIQSLAQELRTVIGLTPRQHGAVTRLRERLTEAGQSAARVQRAVEQAVQVGIRQRALNIARTESMDASALGSHLAWVESVQAGYVDVGQIRRYWETAGESACPECAQIPGMNPEGVGLYELFQTPYGPLLMPTAHPSCRCTITHQVMG